MKQARKWFPSTLILAVLLAALSASNVSAQSALEKLVDEIVGDSPKEDPKKTDDPKAVKKVAPAKAASATEGFVKIPGGLLYKKRADGVEVFVNPERGSVSYRAKDGTVVTQEKDGEVAVQKPGQDFADYLPHRPGRPGIDPSAVKEAPPPVFQIPEPKDDRMHADWREFEEFQKTLRDKPSLPWTPAPGAARVDLPPGTPDGAKVQSIVPLPDGKRIIYRKDGTVQTEFRDGTVITTYPGTGQIAVTDPAGKTTFALPGPGGILQYEIGGATVTVDPEKGTAYIANPDGTKEQVGPTGVVRGDGKGGVELQGAKGEAISQFTSPGKGKVIQSGDKLFVLDGKDNLVGKGTVGKDGKPDVRDLLFDELLALTELKPSKDSKIKAVQTTIRAGTIPGAKQVLPQGNIFEIAKKIYREDFKNDRKVGYKPDQILKIKAFAEAADAKIKGLEKKPDEDELDVTLRKVAIFIKKVDFEMEISKLEKQKASLLKQKDGLAKEKAVIAAQEAKNAAAIAKAKGDDLAFDLEDSALRMKKTLLDFRKKMIDPMEKKLLAEVQGVMGKVDFRLYKLCPEGQQWEKCGHKELKTRWLKDQLSRLLGPGYLEREAKLKLDKADYEKDVKDYENSMRALEKKRDVRQQARKDFAAKSSDLASRSKSISNQEKTFDQQARQLDTQVSELRRRISELGYTGVGP